MGVKVKERNGAWWVFINHKGKRKAKQCASKRAAERIRDQIDARLKLGQLDVLSPPVPVKPATEYPRLRDAVPEWIERQARKREIRATTEHIYKSRLKVWVFPFTLPDGRPLGDLPVNEVTREMLGAVISKAREAGRSTAITAGIRNPLKGYYQDMIETKQLPGPNPAGDLKYFLGKGAQNKKRKVADKFFAREEGPALTATAKAAHPRWHPFMLTGMLAGLRWGESAALRKTDIDWEQARIHVQRTVSDQGAAIADCKDKEDRWVDMSPALADVLRSHIAAMDLEGQVQEWSAEQRALVFPTTYGNRVGYPYFNAKVWQPLLLKAGLRYRPYHATRHTCAIWQLNRGVDPRYVQQQLGHASIAETIDTYGDHIDTERRDAQRVIATDALDRNLTI